MRYALYQHALGPRREIEITEQRFRGICDAWVTLTQMLYIEEDWDCVLHNYVDVEAVVLNSALYGMVFSRPTSAEYQDIRLSYARRLSNVLSACKAYLDHTPQHINKSGVSQSDFSHASFAEATNSAYDSNFGYRFMEALRNHAQHHGLPLHGAGFSSTWVERPDGDAMSISSRATIDLKRIQENKKFKASVLKEIPQNETSIDVVLVLRDYLEALSGVHSHLRNGMSRVVEESAEVIRKAIQDFEHQFPDHAQGLNAGAFDGDNRLLRRVPVIDDMLVRLEHLQRKNSSLVNLKKRFVSNETKVR